MFEKDNRHYCYQPYQLRIPPRWEGETRSSFPSQTFQLQSVLCVVTRGRISRPSGHPTRVNSGALYYFRAKLSGKCYPHGLAKGSEVHEKRT